MEQYRIVAAKPKGATNHCNSSFKIFKWEIDPDDNVKKWMSKGWQTINQVSVLLQAGHEVRTGHVSAGKMNSGDAVELELRIVHNGTKFKISQMPDK